MAVSSEFFILIVTIFATVTLGYPLILWRVFLSIRRPQKEPSLKQWEQKLLSCHQNSLEKMEKQVQTEVREELAVMASKHAETLAKLAMGIAGDYNRSHQELLSATDQHLKDTKLALSEVVKKTEKRVDEELAQDLKKTRAEINDYKERGFKKIDDEIATLVEKTIYKTLGKGLSLEDHLDIIYESLAEAKEEGFFEKDAK